MSRSDIVFIIAILYISTCVASILKFRYLHGASWLFSIIFSTVVPVFSIWLLLSIVREIYNDDINHEHRLVSKKELVMLFYTGVKMMPVIHSTATMLIYAATRNDSTRVCEYHSDYSIVRSEVKKAASALCAA